MDKSTNKWALERAAKLLPKSDPLLMELLSYLIWVVDHQQDQLEQMHKWTKYIIEQALVDHAHSDGTVQINETCREAIKAYWHTEGLEEASSEQVAASLEELEWIKRKEREV